MRKNQIERYESTEIDDIRTVVDYLCEKEMEEEEDRLKRELGGKSATEIYAETGIATSASGFPAEKGRLKGFIVSDEVLDVLTEEEILDAVKRHWSGDAGERESPDDGKLGLESLFTVRKERVIVLTNPSRAQTNIWLESECLF